MRIERTNKTKMPIVKIDKRFNQFQGRILFPEKLAEANRMLAKIGLPKLPKEK